MRNWLFQGNPDTFDIDQYLAESSEILWTVKQKHIASQMSKGDPVFLWRASGKAKAKSGVVAMGVLLESPRHQTEDPIAIQHWKQPSESGGALRVRISLDRVCSQKRSFVQADWLKDDPILSDLRIFKLRNETNYQISAAQSKRLRDLVVNTGRDWTEDESLGGLYAYVKTLHTPVSRRPESIVAEVALAIGRAVTGVYNKVMNFRAIDPSDERSGLSGGSEADRHVWERYFDPKAGALDSARITEDYLRVWGPSVVSTKQKRNGIDQPPDDPEELQQFARRVRKGQPKFRRMLLKLYGEKCAISGWAPESVLEAAHIIEHASTGLNKVENGILLRSDLHGLFDDRLLRIEPSTLRVVVDKKLAKTPYWRYNDVILRPRTDGSRPSKELLERHWRGQD